MTEQITPYAAPIVWGDTNSPAAQTVFVDSRAQRRNPHGWPLRQALLRLRLVEFAAADQLPTDLMQELTAAIDGVIDIIRGHK